MSRESERAAERHGILRGFRARSELPPDVTRSYPCAARLATIGAPANYECASSSGTPCRGPRPEPTVLEVDPRRAAALDLAGQDRVGEQVLDVLLDRALERPRAELGVVALLREPILGARPVSFERDLLLGEVLREARELHVDDRADLLGRQRIEDVRMSSRRFTNSGRKNFAHLVLAAQVARHQDERLREVDRAALAVGQAAVVEQLQQHVEHVRVRLLDLVEEDDASAACGARLR